MMYTVESHFSDPAREEEWNAWYETYLVQLVSLPGLSTAQRFRGNPQVQQRGHARVSLVLALACDGM